MPERRRFERTKISKPAKILCAGRDALVDCIVFDLSVGGAGLDIANAADITDEFELTFDGARTLRCCRIAWRSEGKIGAAFY